MEQNSDYGYHLSNCCGSQMLMSTNPNEMNPTCFKCKRECVSAKKSIIYPAPLDKVVEALAKHGNIK